jgi:membrane protein YqaA with SNARE-associated domain
MTWPAAGNGSHEPLGFVQAGYGLSFVAWSDFAVYAGLFLSALASATLLPGSSEAALLALLSLGRGEAVPLVMVATAGNVLGSFFNWIFGRFFSGFRDRGWFPVKGPLYDRAVVWFRRYGVWSLLLSWAPAVGDALTLVAGALRVDLLRFLILVSAGKAARYVLLVAAFSWWSGG